MKIVWLVCLLILAGCTAPKENIGFGEVKTMTSSNVKTFSHGQKLEYVDGSKGLGRWLSTHEGKVHIDSIVPLGYGAYGATSEFLIVYTEQ
jgi:hypothetical protein